MNCFKKNVQNVNKIHFKHKKVGYDVCLIELQLSNEKNNRNWKPFDFIFILRKGGNNFVSWEIAFFRNTFHRLSKNKLHIWSKLEITEIRKMSIFLLNI